MGYDDVTFTSDQSVDPSVADDDYNDAEEGSMVSRGTGFDYFLENGQLKFSWRKLWLFTGPGFLMSIAYLDPGNLEADLQAGATTQYDLLWVLFWATVMGLILQNIVAKLGVVSGKHLAQHCTTFPKPVRYTLWIMTETALICADCQEVVGSAIAIKILSGGKVPIYAGCLITAADCFAFMLLDKKGMRKLEALFGIFITTMVVTFGIQYFSRLPPQDEVFRGWAEPRITSNDAFQSAAGLIGAVIMPHNLFLHSALVLSRKIDRNFATNGKRAEYKVSEAVFYNKLESTIALMISFGINLFVVAVFANLDYYKDGKPVCFYDGHTITPKGDNGTDQIGLLSAGDCLEAVYDASWWKYIWALGVLAAGQASTITGTYAGQFIMEGFLDMKVKPATRTFISRCFSLIPALIVAIETPGDPSGMDNLNEWLNVAQSIQLPFAMLPALYFAMSPSRCKQWATKGKTAALVWCISLLVLISNVYAIIQVAYDLPNEWYVWLVFSLFCIFYFSVNAYLVLVCIGFVKIEEPYNAIADVPTNYGDQEDESE
eukprot:TRINITY_DN3051_c1_g1_i1.p1 TRINITY_DN3051_c1_g1~~TRINITY_DN3051_c1_g1_i1.p1  ORF type:complete len:545 (+),score=81.16 TRINITY_DN3051_c1_g1_i1:70-1704(+)